MYFTSGVRYICSFCYPFVGGVCLHCFLLILVLLSTANCSVSTVDGNVIVKSVTGICFTAYYFSFYFLNPSFRCDSVCLLCTQLYCWLICHLVLVDMWIQIPWHSFGGKGYVRSRGQVLDCVYLCMCHLFSVLLCIGHHIFKAVQCIEWFAFFTCNMCNSSIVLYGCRVSDMCSAYFEVLFVQLCQWAFIAF
jgi:uncharacterized membrane protein (GlpM family)